ncbi:MAG: rod shape-determining protein [Oligoflexus sp.]
MATKTFRSFRSLDVAIDLGTSQTSVFVNGEGLVYQEPSMISMRSSKHCESVLAIGSEAYKMKGKEPLGVTTIKPLHSGVIDKLEAAKLMLNEIAKRTKICRFLKKPRILVGAPFKISDVERRAVMDALSVWGSFNIAIIEEPLAAAIGADIDITESVGNVVIDIGSGITEAVVISLGGIVRCESMRVGGDAITDALITYFRNHYNLIVGEQSIELLKPLLCDIYGESEEIVTIKGIDVRTYLPQTKAVRSSHVRDAILPPINAILHTCRLMLENTPPELAGDLIERGVILTGGSAQLLNLDQFLEKSFHVPVRIAHDSAGATLRGISHMLDKIDIIRMMD